jgi:hypothetical protein
MGAHPSGDGVAWDSLEAIDVDQPHGLDYRSQQHMAIAVRKRMSQEHETFGDTTAGGIHKPGGSAVLGMEITDAAGDPTSAVVADGTYRGHGLVWSYVVQAGADKGVLWCWTAVAGLTDTPGVGGTADWTVMKLHPDLQWGGGDITWAGAHQFDNSVEFLDPVDFTGPVIVEGSCDFSDVFVAGDISVAGTVKIATDLTLTGDMAVDGTSNFNDEVDLSSANLSGLAGFFGTDNTEDSDNASLAEDVTYQVSSDGFVIVCVTDAGGAVDFGIFVDTTAGMDSASEIGRAKASAAGSPGLTITAPVPKDGFWCITKPTGVLNKCRWQPIGDGSCDKNI